MARKTSTITSSSTAEYFAKNLQQVGFSSPVKAVLTTLKEAVDNSLDACEENKILPEIKVFIEKLGKGSGKKTDLIKITIEDNGPGLEQEIIPKVFGEYLASSKFGRGQCSRGQQGIGISAATTWAQLTNAQGVEVMSKTARMRKALKMVVDVDIKNNKGQIKKKETVEWDKPNGLRISFSIDGRLQLNGDGGILTYLEGTALLNPHLDLIYKIADGDLVEVRRVTDVIPQVPPPTPPHPHTMKLGEFITHASLFGKTILSKFLKKEFSRVTDSALKEFTKNGLNKSWLAKPLSAIKDSEFKTIFQAIQESDLANPSTRSVLTVGEEGLAKSIHRLGDVDFFSVITRKPKICDFKPVVVEVAIARFLDRGSDTDTIKLLRFANRVPLQFDRASCAITKAVESVAWRPYGLQQSKNSLPTGPYVFAVSVTSPFIKFKNASKETIDSSDELIEEIRLALMRAGQKLSRHIKRENKAADLERKIRHIEKFGPILVEGLISITGSSKARKKRAEDGLSKILGRDTDAARSDLTEAEAKLAKLKAKQSSLTGNDAEAEASVATEPKKKVTQKPGSKAVANSSGKKKVTKKTGKKTAKKVTKKTKSVKKKTKKKSTKR